MSFSIFSSKLSQIIAIFSVVLLGCFLLTSGALKAYIFLKTTNNYYVQEIGSKARHMGLNYNDTSPDIVFVGSSRTEYHINTSVFKEGGVNAYNYGMSGGDLANFPYMVKQAISVKPKYIVISLPAYKVLDDDLQIDDGLHADDVKMLLSLPFNKQQKLKGLASFVAGINTIRIYSEAINGKIKSLYKKFDARNQSNEKPAKHQMTEPLECNVIKSTVITKEKTSYICSNGDAALYGAYEHEQKAPNITPENKRASHPKTLLLTQIAAQISAENITPIFVMEPYLDRKSKLNVPEFQKEIGAAIIDLSDLPLEKNMWADSSHFNVIGRNYYSKVLANRLETLTEKNRGTEH